MTALLVVGLVLAGVGLAMTRRDAALWCGLLVALGTDWRGPL